MHIYLLKGLYQWHSNKPLLAANPNNNDKEAVFKHCATFTDCIIEINNTQIDKAKDTLM